MRHAYANGMAWSLVVLASSALLASCATTCGRAASLPEGKGNYAHADEHNCDVRDCVAHVEIYATCKSGPLKFKIWRDAPLRGPVLYTDGLGDQALGGTTTLNVPVCAPEVRSVQAMLIQVDGACANNVQDTLTVQFKCFVR
jgi:hypothetical protein